MTTAADPASFDSLSRRRQSRVARQARVGILRNPNEPPRPPPRKASLTGRWLSLRSSRRPPPERVLDAARAVVGPSDTGDEPADLAAAALVHDETGRLAGINVAGLMASVEGLGTNKPIRTPYGAQMRPDLPVDADAPTRPAPPPPPRDAPALTPVIDAEPPSRAAAPRPAAALPDGPVPRRSLLLPVLGGVGLALVILVVIPAVMAL